MLAELAKQRGYNALLSGANKDDQGDWRPGLRAAAEHGVVHPLQDTTKAEVRELARRFELPSAEKPASPVPGEPHPVRHRRSTRRRSR